MANTRPDCEACSVSLTTGRYAELYGPDMHACTGMLRCARRNATCGRTACVLRRRERSREGFHERGRTRASHEIIGRLCGPEFALTRLGMTSKYRLLFVRMRAMTRVSRGHGTARRVGGHRQAGCKQRLDVAPQTGRRRPLRGAKKMRETCSSITYGNVKFIWTSRLKDCFLRQLIA